MSRFDLNLDEAAACGRNRRFFSLQEADRALVLVRRVVADIVSRYGRLVDLQETIEAAQRGGAYDQVQAAQAELITVAEKIQACAEELDDVGVELRDWSVGVVDFPCRTGGREVCLCWRYGEDRVSHWHEADAGTDARKPIATLPADEPAPV